MTIIEKIITNHSSEGKISPGDIVEMEVDVRLARDFGGANVVKNIIENNLSVDNPEKTFFTFDCNPTGSDQKYASNQQFCRKFATDNNIKVYDINAGIGTHLAIDKRLAFPGSTVVSTDSHANILGAIGAFGQGMGDQDIAAVWANGATWFKVPESVKINFEGKRNPNLSAKEIVLNLLNIFGANKLLGYSVELYGEEVQNLNLDERITISSMATEMGAIAIFIPPTKSILEEFEATKNKNPEDFCADQNANYAKEFNLNFDDFTPLISLPGHPDKVTQIDIVENTFIDSAFIGSCTNGRMEDLRIAANILKDKKVSPNVVLKIVPSTDEIWNQCLNEGIIDIFKKSGALVGNAGCAGCAAGQIGQNGPGEVTISTGNRNFAGKQGKGDVYLASPAIAAASAIAGYITTPDKIPAHHTPSIPKKQNIESIQAKTEPSVSSKEIKTVITGKVWIIEKDNIDTDMIYHNQHLSITDIDKMGKYTFGNLEEWEDYAVISEPGDIIITGKNFGAGSSRQQAVDCFKALKNQAILAQSFGAIYERNAINAAFPVINYDNLDILELKSRDTIQLNLETGEIINLRNNNKTSITKFSGVQMKIYKKGGLLKK